MAKDRRAGRCVCRGILATILCIGASSSPRAWDSPQWVRQLGTISYDLATGIATDGEGNVYISGTTEGIAGIPGDSGSLGAPIGADSTLGSLNIPAPASCGGRDNSERLMMMSHTPLRLTPRRIFT